MRRPFSILMFQTVARAKDQCQLARNETQVHMMPVCFQRKKQYFLTFRQPSNFFLPFFLLPPLACLSIWIPFQPAVSTFFHNMYLCDWKLQLNENFTNFTNSTFYFFYYFSYFICLVKVLEIRYYYKMPDLFRTCPC